MQPSERWLLAIALVLLDAVVFVIPVTGLMAAWVLIARPPQFYDLVQRLYNDGEST